MPTGNPSITRTISVQKPTTTHSKQPQLSSWPPWRAALLQPSHPCEGGTRPSGCSSQTVAGKQTLQLRFNCAPACLTPISLSHRESTVQLLPLQCSTLQSPENSPHHHHLSHGGLAEAPGITVPLASTKLFPPGPPPWTFSAKPTHQEWGTQAPKASSGFSFGWSPLGGTFLTSPVPTSSLAPHIVWAVLPASDFWCFIVAKQHRLCWKKSSSRINEGRIRPAWVSPTPQVTGQSPALQTPT